MELDEDALRELEQVLTIALIRLSTRDTSAAQQEDGSYPCRNGYSVLALDDFERRGLLQYEPDSNTLELSPAGAAFGDRALNMLVAGLESGFGFELTPVYAPAEEAEVMPDNRIFHLRIDLDLGDLPACWREITIRADATFLDLHLAIQRTFAWNEEHLFAFELMLPNGERTQIDELAHCDLSFYDSPSLPTDTIERSAHEVRLNEIFDNERSVTYFYDLKTRWRHTITLVNVNDIEDVDASIPCLLAGAGDAPPDGISNLDEYRHLLTVLAGPRNAERAQIMKRLQSQGYRSFDAEEKARELAGFFIRDYERWNEQIDDAERV